MEANLVIRFQDGDCEITIPAGHVDGVPRSFVIGRDHFLYEWYLDVQLFYSCHLLGI